MTYQTSQQFSPNRLTEEANQAGEQAAVQAPTDLTTQGASTQLSVQPPERLGVAGPAATVTTTTDLHSQTSDDETVTPQIIARLTKAAGIALHSEGQPTSLKKLEELISP